MTGMDLTQDNIKDDNMFLGIFNSQGVETEMRPFFNSEPIKVKLLKSYFTDDWIPADSALLEFGKVRGAIIPSHYRAGLWKT